MGRAPAPDSSRRRLRGPRGLPTLIGVRLVVVAAFALATLSAPGARADGLTIDETSRLLEGQSVARTQDLTRGSRRYVGGVTYTVVDGTPDDVTAVLDDVRYWRRFLPKARDARLVGTLDGDPLVRVTHGSAIVQVSYVLRVHRDGNVVRFWMDESREHDIEDAWGFFRAEPMRDGRTLVTYGILVDMGDGLLRDLFESRMRQLALDVPVLVRDVIIERQARGRRAAR
jgi:hypothetical protein